MAELRAQKNETLGGALQNYLDTEQATPGTMRMFLGNLYENATELAGISPEQIKQRNNEFQLALEYTNLLSQGYTEEELAPYFPENMKQIMTQQAIDIGGVAGPIKTVGRSLKSLPSSALSFTGDDYTQYSKFFKDVGSYDEYVRNIRNQLAGAKPIDKVRVNLAGEVEPYDVLGMHLDKAGTMGFANPPYIYKGMNVSEIDYPLAPTGSYLSPVDLQPRSPVDRFEMDVLRGQKRYSEPPRPIEKYEAGMYGTAADAWYGPGVYASSDLDIARTYGPDLYTLFPNYKRTGQNVLQTYKTFATISDPQMRQKLIALFGDKIATDYRHLPIADVIRKAGTTTNQAVLFDELQKLGIDELQHIDVVEELTPTTAMLGGFDAYRIPPNLVIESTPKPKPNLGDDTF